MTIIHGDFVENLNLILLFSEMVFCMIAAMTFVLSKTIEIGRRTLVATTYWIGAALLLSDLCSWLAVNRPGELALWVSRVSTFFLFFLPDMLFACFHGYVFHCLFGDCKGLEKEPWFPTIRFYGNFMLAILCMIWNTFSQYHTLTYSIDNNNVYTRGPLFIVVFIIPVISLLIDLSVVIQFRKNATKRIVGSLISYILLPAGSAILLQFTYGISLLNISIGVAMIIVYVAAILEQNRVERERREEMYNQQIDLMLSQVGPHFIYNTLTTIKHLCKTDTKMAVETIDEFAIYLRGNLDSLMVREKIPFSQELNHVKNYIAIEKKRFGERVKVEYEIEEDSFLIPALVLQPVVENAIRHGITVKPEGGTVKIRTFKTDREYVISVEDDGVGFDSVAFMEQDPKIAEKIVVGNQEIQKRHVGMTNVRDRLRTMCRGTLTIDSIVGKGTQAMMHIPRED